MKIRSLVIFSIFILTGCTSVPVPTTEQNTLLVGKLFVNWNVTGKMSGGNGKVKVGIKTYFLNNQTGKVISVTTQKDGWLLTNKLNGGNYTIQKYYIEKNQGGTIYIMTLNGPYYITIEEGMVNNIGTIKLDIGIGKYTYSMIDYDVVKFDFQSEFSDSEWNSYEWKNIFLLNE